MFQLQWPRTGRSGRGRVAVAGAFGRPGSAHAAVGFAKHAQRSPLPAHRVGSAAPTGPPGPGTPLLGLGLLAGPFGPRGCRTHATRVPVFAGSLATGRAALAGGKRPLLSPLHPVDATSGLGGSRLDSFALPGSNPTCLQPGRLAVAPGAAAAAVAELDVGAGHRGQLRQLCPGVAGPLGLASSRRGSRPLAPWRRLRRALLAAGRPGAQVRAVPLPGQVVHAGHPGLGAVGRSRGRCASAQPQSAAAGALAGRSRLAAYGPGGRGMAGTSTPDLSGFDGGFQCPAQRGCPFPPLGNPRTGSSPPGNLLLCSRIGGAAGRLGCHQDVPSQALARFVAAAYSR